jgi:hypothetical protein
MSDESVIPLAHALWHVLAPLLGETSRTSAITRHTSHAAWLPSAHSAKVEVPHQLSAG